MAGVQVQSVIVNMTGGRLSSQFFNAKIAVGGHAVSESEVHRVLEACHASVLPDRSALHSLPTGFTLGSTESIRDPRGLIGDELGAAMHVVSTDGVAVRNLMLAIERCHLEVEAVVATPYASGLAALVDDEAELGTALIDIGGGTTSVGIFSGGNLTHADAFAVGGRHITMDLARGLNIPLADAERIKTLHGTCLTSASDDRETIAVLQVGEDADHGTQLPKSQLTRIIKPRVEEILELVRDRLKGGRLSRAFGSPHRADGRRVPARRIAGGGQTHRLRTGSHRTPARHPGVAGIGEGARLLGIVGAARLSAGERHRTFPPRRLEDAARAVERQLLQPRRTLAEGQFLRRAGEQDGAAPISYLARLGRN